MTKAFWVILLCVFHYVSFSQKSTIDSLYFKLNQTNIDSQKVNLLNKLFVFFSSNNNDSALKFALRANALSNKINFDEGRITSINNIGTVYYYQGRNGQALAKFLEVISLTEKYEKKNGVNSFTKSQLSVSYNNIGTIYQRQKEYQKAEDFFLKSIGIDTLASGMLSAAHCYNNIGTIKEEQSKYDEAILNYEKALKIKIRVNDSLGIPSTLINIGIVKMNQNRFDEASSFFLKAQDYCRKTNNVQDQALALINLGDLYFLKKDYATSIPYYLEGIKICKDQKYLQFLSYAYQSLSQSYYKIKNLEKAYETFQLHVNTKDTIYNQDNIRVLHEMETKFESDNKEKEIRLLTADKEVQQAELNKNRIIIYSSLGGFILISCFAFYAAYAFNQKKKINHELDLKNQKISHAYKIIDLKQKEMLDSINYAKRIQYALLAHEEFLNKHLPDNFVYFKPKDIVSGDFYWATKAIDKNEDKLFYLACCDSTGHGVPGAFMSLLSIGFLSEAIKEKDIYQPNKVFDYVRKRLIESISSDEQKDGFDGILICFNLTTGKLTYAAANNKPLLVSGDTSTIMELPCDKMPVGKADLLNSFNLFEIPGKSGDTLYLCTDGYADQFGGPKGKKFKNKPLNTLLLAISKNTMIEQNNVLEQNFSEWRGKLEQVDDICVIGVKL